MAFDDYATTAAANTTIAGINIAENCPAANMNNAFRQIMADARGYSDLVTPALGGILQLGDGVEPAVTTTSSLSADYFGKSLRVAMVADIVVTLPTPIIGYADELIAFYVLPGVAFKITISASFADGTTSLVLYADEAVVLQCTGSVYRIRGYEKRRIGGRMVRGSGAISLADGVWSDVTMTAADSSFLPNASFFDGTKIVIPRRARYRIRSIVHLTPAGACQVSISLPQNGGTVDVNAYAEMTCGATKIGISCELVTSLNAGTTIVPRVKTTGSTGAVDLSIPPLLTIDEVS